MAGSKKTPAANFVHYALGPVSEADRQWFNDADENAHADQKVGRGGYSRFVYGPAVRDDVYPTGRVGWELRQHSSAWRRLVQEMGDLSALLSNGRVRGFQEFANVETIHKDLLADGKIYLPSFNERAVESLLQKVGTYLDEEAGIKPGAASFADRFLFPLRRWTRHPLVRDNPAAIERVQTATAEYVNELQKMINAPSLPPEQATEKLRLAVARWAATAKLGGLFTQKRHELVDGDSDISTPSSMPAGPRRGEPLDSAYRHARAIPIDQVAQFGFARNNAALYMTDVRHAGRFWAAQIPVERILDARLLVIPPGANNGAGVRLRFVFSAEAPIILRSLSNAQQVEEIRDLIFAVGPHPVEGEKFTPDKKDAPEFALVERFLSLKDAFPRWPQAPIAQRSLQVDTVGRAELLTQALARAEEMGNRNMFNYTCRNCTTEPAHLVAKVISPRPWIGSLIEFLTKNYSTNAGYALKVWTAKGWIRSAILPSVQEEQGIEGDPR
jgi:hypothetical protein